MNIFNSIMMKILRNPMKVPITLSGMMILKLRWHAVKRILFNIHVNNVKNSILLKQVFSTMWKLYMNLFNININVNNVKNGFSITQLFSTMWKVYMKEESFLALSVSKYLQWRQVSSLMSRVFMRDYLLLLG